MTNENTEAKTEEARTCANCACKQEATEIGTQQKQSFCRRNPPHSQMMRVDVPRVGRDGQPVIRDGKPVMEPGQARVFGYPPVQDDMVCFDGWRPTDTKPGEQFNSLLTTYTDIMKKLWFDMHMQGQERFDDGKLQG